MKTYKYCPIIEIGDVFTRIDRNGKVWEAKVINRTEYFVDVEKTQPYKIKVADKNFGEYGLWNYEDAPKTIERCELYRHYEEIEDGEEETLGLYGKYMKKKYKKVPTAKYFIKCKEDYSAHSKYDRLYELIKYEDTKSTSAQEGFDLFYKYCEEN